MSDLPHNEKIALDKVSSIFRKITPLTWLVLTIVLFGTVSANIVSKPKSPVCPNDSKDSRVETVSFYGWLEGFIDDNQSFPGKEMSRARVDFWIDNNCKEALKMYADYMSGNVDKETQQLIEMVIKEEIKKEGF